MTREAIVIGEHGTEILDLDPIDLENNGPVASAWDENLHNVLDAMDDFTDETGASGLRLVWSDDMSPVLVECSVCACVKDATTCTVDVMDGDLDYLICTDCANN